MISGKKYREKTHDLIKVCNEKYYQLQLLRKGRRRDDFEQF